MQMIPRFAPSATPFEHLSFVMDTIVPGRVSQARVQEFETEFAHWLGSAHAIFVPSARMGLHLLLEALDYPFGSEIIVPAFTYFAIPAVLRNAGYKVVYADVEPTTFEISARTVRPVLTRQTRAIIPTHLFGRTCPMAGLQKLATNADIDIIEDCAQSCGTHTAEGKTGTLGRAAYFTFGITKNFATYSGGMVTTMDHGLAASIRQAMTGFARPPRSYLLKQAATAAAMTAATQRMLFNLSLRPVVTFFGPSDDDPVHRAFAEAVRPITGADITRLHIQPSGPQAAAGLRQLATVDANNSARRDRGQALLQALRSRGTPGIPSPAGRNGDHIFVSFAIRRPHRAQYGALLRNNGVDFSPGYMSACSNRPELGGRPGLCPEADACEREIIHLPLYPGLTDQDLLRIADGVARADREAGVK
jgi:perosamine synthetase